MLPDFCARPAPAATAAIDTYFKNSDIDPLHKMLLSFGGDTRKMNGAAAPRHLHGAQA